LQLVSRGCLGKHLCGSKCGGGHDIEIAGVLRQEVAQTFYLEINRNTIAINRQAPIKNSSLATKRAIEILIKKARTNYLPAPVLGHTQLPNLTWQQ